MITKDQSIVGQVAAKIAADISVASGGDPATLGMLLAAWADAFKVINDEMGTFHGWDDAEEAAVAAVTKAFNARPVEDRTPTAKTTSGIRVAGKQHGELPDWLIKDAAAAGVSEVWDNRDKLADNSKRPWFKAVNGDKAFWPPKGGK